MSMDERLPVKSCMFGCHSELDKYRSEGTQYECPFENRHTEKACDGCERRESKVGAGDMAVQGDILLPANVK